MVRAEYRYSDRGFSANNDLSINPGVPTYRIFECAQANNVGPLMRRPHRQRCGRRSESCRTARQSLERFLGDYHHVSGVQDLRLTCGYRFQIAMTSERAVGALVAEA